MDVGYNISKTLSFIVVTNFIFSTLIINGNNEIFYLSLLML